MNDAVSRTGGQILIDQLRTHGVDRIFCVPGESYLAALDALHDVPDEIAVVVCRNEGGAAYMAEAYGKLTGRPGICFVTRGPGASNAAVGIHTAFQDSTPLILFVGQVGRGEIGREAFQELDYRRFFTEMSKWVVQIDEAARIPELVSQAFHRAVNGRQGPVVVALPEDMLSDTATVRNIAHYRQASTGVDVASFCELEFLLRDAERPLMVVGGGGWTQDAVADLRKFSEAWALPVATSFRCQDLFPNDHPNYAGDLGIAAGPKLISHVHNCDVLLVIGARLGEMTTRGYSLLEVPVPRQRLVHVHASAEELGRVYQANLPINTTVSSFTRRAAISAPGSEPRWVAWTREANEDYQNNLRHKPIPGQVQMGVIMSWLRQHLRADTIVTTGAGNYSAWVHRFYQYRQFRTQLGPTNGSMGYGVPAAIAAKLTMPERTVVAFAGDGCFLMNGQELATAVRYGANIIILVINNGMYGTIRMHQERTYPGRISATDLTNPDFVAYARAFGAHGELVEKTDDFPDAFLRAEQSGKPALIELRIDPEALTPDMTLSQIRSLALQSRQADRDDVIR
jgi:acetolactate synthase-1/2/3 large subunit